MVKKTITWIDYMEQTLASSWWDRFFVKLKFALYMRLHVYVRSLELALPIERYIKKYRKSIAGIRETFEVYYLIVWLLGICPNGWLQHWFLFSKMEAVPPLTELLRKGKEIIDVEGWAQRGYPPISIKLSLLAPHLRGAHTNSWSLSLILSPSPVRYFFMFCVPFFFFLSLSQDWL